MLCNCMLLTIVNETNLGSVCMSVYMLDRKNDTVNMVTTLRLDIMSLYANIGLYYNETKTHSYKHLPDRTDHGVVLCTLTI